MVVQMDKIKELRPGAGIELMAVIVNMQPRRKLWKCYECKQQGLWKTREEFQDVCPVCKAEISKEKGKGIWIQEVTSALIEDDSGQVYLDLWNQDVDRFKIGDKIHLIDGYARSNGSNSVNVSKGKFGSIMKE